MSMHHSVQLNLGIFQFTPAPSNIMSNLARVEAALKNSSYSVPNILLLPELWATGPLEKCLTGLAEKTDRALQGLKELAHRYETTVIGTLPELSEDRDRVKCYNTTYVVTPWEAVPAYRKIHLFNPMGEDRVFQHGTEPGVHWLKIKDREIGLGLMTCFDLRFPELCRELVYQGAEIILISALWPHVRRDHFKSLMKARAIENQCFAAGANAWGTCGDIRFGGCSRIISPSGSTMVRAQDCEQIIVARIDTSEIRESRQLFFTAHPSRFWQPRAERKKIGPENLKKAVARRRRAGLKMVFTNGCFDIFHAGHAAYLEAARASGDYLVVGLNSDSSVAGIKGPSRPINPQEWRADILAALSTVDFVVVFNEPDPGLLIRELMPEVLVKGADWEEDDIIGADTVKKAGGRVVRIPFDHDVSTTSLIDRLRSSS
ncbi:MAG TPA: D-glycero-beta-D-manno-heptose 1-phosphate adenylyltransferase [Thermodesulfobacteriaceae bacterium]|nr:D-glycero-beta-D-manno-heptose 1-phosphate adenylyltransferase [Thermodesulfobacteriaceae bacterium]